MKLQIDNLDGLGPRNYTADIDATQSPQLVRKLNKPSELQFSLVATSPDFVVPALGARVTFGKANGGDVFTGYLMQVPTYEYLGWGERGPVYRYRLTALSDEALLDHKRLPDCPPFVERSAGSALRQLTQDLLPGIFDTSSVQEMDTITGWAPSPEKTWSQEIAEIAVQARAAYRAMSGALRFTPLGTNVYKLDESEVNFTPSGLKLQPASRVLNDVTVIGEIEPRAYVKDYFVGDGLTMRFYLSHTPFNSKTTTVFNEEYTAALDPSRWCVVDPSRAVSVTSGRLQINGGTGVDSGTVVQFVEQVELGGALVMQHGDVMFSGASAGILGGLYNGTICRSDCIAGFAISANGNQSQIQAIVNGAVTGAAINTNASHHYFLTTRFYSDDIYRQQQIFHSSLHPAGQGIGGGAIAANVRMVLEVHDIDPSNPGSQTAPAVVLFDGEIAAAPGFCTYALVNAGNMQCNIAFTRLLRPPDAEVRSALPGESNRTRLVGSLSDGAECNVTSSAELAFYTAYVPAANELIEVKYRDAGRALARVTNPDSIAAQKRGVDDGVLAWVRRVKLPLARTAADCENAALALLDDGINIGWAGQYTTWSDSLPSAATDIFPGDGLQTDVPSQGASFEATVREVQITFKDLQTDHSLYTIRFADDAAERVSFEFEDTQASASVNTSELTNAQAGQMYLADVTGAEVTNVDSTTISIDAGVPPATGGGFELRWSDAGWGPDNDRNLIGRFDSRTFTVPRLSRVQDCYLRQYDGSTPPKYSRYTSALHVDYPL